MSRKPLLVITLLGLLFFADLVVHPGQLLYSDYSDMIPLHLPARRFLARTWQEMGTVPLWCPNNLGGMPFVHDVQSSVFYPLHWPLLALPEQHQGAAMSWLIVLHVILAGGLMYVYARHRGLGSFGALVAALGYMFAGKWLLHLLAGGHYNMVPLAWLPLLLLFFERAIGQRSLLWATWAGAAYALMILAAYPYITLYVGMFVALWSALTVMEGGETNRLAALLRWLGYGAWTAGIGVALGAVQLLPSLEAAGLASRSLGVPASTGTLTDGLWALVGLVGPPLTHDPDWLWENRAGVGLIWFALAIVGVRLTGRSARLPVIACVALLLFACGGAVVCQGLPGFRLFQLPSRILLLVSFPLSLLAGMAADRLSQAPRPSMMTSGFCKLLGGMLGLLGFLALLLWRRGEALAFQPYWLTLLVTLPALAWCLRQPMTSPRQAVLAAALVMDAWGIGLPLVSVRPESELFAPSASAQFLVDHQGERGRVLDIAPAGASANETPLWPGMAMALDVEPVRGFNPVDVLRYKEFLQLLTDRDEPLRPLDRMFTSALMGGFPIRNQRLADLLGVRYLLQPRDVPLENMVPDPAARKNWRPVFEDPAPRSFNFIPATPNGQDCGFQTLPPYRIYENTTALPRAFVVPEARPLPDRSTVLDTLKNADFRHTVWLEGCLDLHSSSSGTFHAATIEDYQANRVGLRVNGTAGYLVLTDVWFPGWRCSVDGQDVPLYRGDFAFRAVAVPAGSHQVVFRLDPTSYRIGKAVSLSAVALVLAFSLAGLHRILNSRMKVHSTSALCGMSSGNARGKTAFRESALRGDARAEPSLGTSKIGTQDRV